MRDLSVFDVEKLLRGRVHFGLLWNTLRDVDQLLESGESVLLYSENGERRSAFVAVCYLKSKCRDKKASLTAIIQCVATCVC